MSELGARMELHMVRGMLDESLNMALGTLHGASLLELGTATNLMMDFRREAQECKKPRELAEAFVRAINRAMPISLERE